MSENTKARGERSEAHVLAAVLDRGWAASIPFGNNQRYDLILDDGESLFLTQIKTAWLAGGCLVFATASKNGFTGVRQTYEGDIDMFLVYSPELKKVYRVPVDAAPKSAMHLRVAPLANCEDKKGVRWAKDFEFDPGPSQEK